MQDAESAYCQYAVLHMNYKPNEFVNLPQKEKAFLIACIDNKVKAEREAAEKYKK